MNMMRLCESVVQIRSSIKKSDVVQKTVLHKAVDVENLGVDFLGVMVSSAKFIS